MLAMGFGCPIIMGLVSILTKQYFFKQLMLLCPCDRIIYTFYLLVRHDRPVGLNRQRQYRCIMLGDYSK